MNNIVAFYENLGYNLKYFTDYGTNFNFPKSTNLDVIEAFNTIFEE